MNAVAVFMLLHEQELRQHWEQQRIAAAIKPPGPMDPAEAAPHPSLEGRSSPTLPSDIDKTSSETHGPPIDEVR